MCFLLAGFGPAQSAPPAPPSSVARPQTQLSRGLAALQQKDFTRASRELEAALREFPSPDILFFLGLAAHGEGRVIEAHDRLGRYLAEVGTEDPLLPEQRERAAEARRILSLPRPLCGMLTVLGERGALVSIDGRPVGTLPLARPLLIPTTEITLDVELKGTSARERITVPTSRMAELRVSLSTRAVVFSLFPSVLFHAETGSLPDGFAPRVTQAVESVLQSERLSPLSREAVRKRAPELLPSQCMQDPACQAKLARTCGAAYVLSLRAERAAEASQVWSLALALLDADVADTAASTQIVCDECDEDKATTLLAASLPALLATARMRQRGTIEIASEPPGAQVRTLDRVLGVTPLVHRIWAGVHEVILTKRDYANSYHKLLVRPDNTEKLHAVLSAEQPDLPPGLAPKPQTVVLRPPVWRLGVGGAALVTGAVLTSLGSLYLSGATASSCVGQSAQFCELAVQIGAPLTTLGGVFLIGGGLLVGLPGRTLQIPGQPAATR